MTEMRCTMLEKVNSYIWGKGLIMLLLLSGAVYTVKTGFVQFRMFPYIFKRLRVSKNKRSQFRIFSMYLGNAMGTGNITGVASAIGIGGAGAVFWMWISAFTGMALVYAENCLSAKYSRKSICGPMAYIRFGVGSRLLSVVFAVCCLLASFGMGGMVQINEMANNIGRIADIPVFLMFTGMFSVIFISISGGSRRISSIAQFLLPVATLSYSFLCVSAIISSECGVPDVFARIFAEALGIKQFFGGVSGYSISKAVSVGIRRGIFSNEAGLGSSPILHSSAENYRSAETQGMCSMLEVFIDTFLCCTLTAVTLLCTGAQTVYGAFAPVTGKSAEIILAAQMSVFAFCTVIGWSYCGMRAFSYIFGRCPMIFYFLFSAAAASGAVFRTGELWILSDIFNGLMAFANIFALLYLAKDVRKE